MNLKLAYDKSNEKNLFNDINNLPYELKEMIFVQFIRNVDRVFKRNVIVFFDSMKYYKMSYQKLHNKIGDVRLSKQKRIYFAYRCKLIR
jgi:hypothetical protein